MFNFLFNYYLPRYNMKSYQDKKMTWHIISAFMNNPAKDGLAPVLKNLLRGCCDVYVNASGLESDSAPENHTPPLTIREIREKVNLPDIQTWKGVTEVNYPGEEPFNIMLDDLYYVGCSKSAYEYSSKAHTTHEAPSS